MADLISSSPVSRTVQLTRSTFSSGIFGGGRSSLFAPRITPQNIDPRSLGVDRGSVENQTVLNNISSQLSNFAVQIRDIGTSLNTITSLLISDSNLEIRRERQQADQERILNEQDIRDTKENIIERKMQSALIAPVAAIGQKTQSILQTLMGFFGTLLGGWLLNQGINALKANAEGSRKKLEEIKDAVIKNLSIAGGIFLLINGGFIAITRIIGRVTLNILKAVGNLLFIKPFRFVADLIKNLIQKVRPPAPTPKLPVTPGAKPPAIPGAKPGVKPSGGGLPWFGGAISFGANLLEGKSIEESAAIAGGGMAGSWAGAKAGAAAGLIFGPKGAALGGILGGLGGFFGGEMLGGEAYNRFFGKGENNQSEPQQSSAFSPQTSMMPRSEDFNMNFDLSSMFNMSGNEGDGSIRDPNMVNFDMPPSFGEVNMQPSEGTEPLMGQKPSEGERTPAVIATIRSPENAQASRTVGPLPDPKPSIIMARTSSATSSQGGTSAMPPKTTAVNNVPAISSSNPDNFYVLYSQVHYNVVI
jgi:hypothetical protein